MAAMDNGCHTDPKEYSLETGPLSLAEKNIFGPNIIILRFVLPLRLVTVLKFFFFLLLL